ncbi:MAG: lyase [Gammaproteobacteria bacterium]|nr:lyase [Gammaproteobacteria bacterium]MCI0591787.1 lyase [Gammaproteobacteria bacterium]
MRYFAIVVPVFLIWTTDSVAIAMDGVQIMEWHVPWENTRPRDPFVDGNNRVWFVGQAGDYVASFDPSSGEFERFDLDSGTGPHNLVVDENGHVWYAGNQKAYIGKLDPQSGQISRYPMPDPAAKDPHTLVIDHGGDIWFTVQWGNFVGKLTRETGKVDLIPVPTARARPYGIVIALDNRPWIAEFGSAKLATVNLNTMELQELALPRKSARPRRITATSDGAIWYVDYAEGYLGRMDPGMGKVKEWQVPGGSNAGPYGMTVDDRDRLWFVETGRSPNRLVGFDPNKEAFFSLTEIESGGGAVRNMYYHKATGAIWFGTDANTIGRARIR